MKGQYQLRNDLLDLHKQFLNKRLNFQWLKGYFLLISEKKRNRWLFGIYIIFILIIGILFNEFVNFSINQIQFSFSSFNFINLLVFLFILAMFETLFIGIIDYLPPILLVIRKYIPKEISYDKTYFKNYLNIIILVEIIANVVYILIFAYHYDLFDYPVIYFFLGILLTLILIEGLLPSYLWNIVLSSTIGYYQNEKTVELDKKRDLTKFEELMKTNNEKGLFLNKKSIIHNGSDIGAYFTGPNYKEIKVILIIFIFLFIIFNVFFIIFKFNISFLVILSANILMISYILYELNIITINRAIMFKRKILKVKLNVYSQKLLNIEVKIPTIEYHDHRELHEYSFWDRKEFMYLDEKIPVEIDKEQEIEINGKTIRYTVNKMFLQQEYGGYYPKKLIIVIP